jgi:hypothetical protein
VPVPDNFTPSGALFPLPVGMPLDSGFVDWFHRLNVAVARLADVQPLAFGPLADEVARRVVQLKRRGVRPQDVVKAIRRDVTSALCRAGGTLASFELLSVVRREVVNWCIDAYVAVEKGDVSS